MGAPTRSFILLSAVFCIVSCHVAFGTISEDDEEILRRGPISKSDYLLGSVLAVVPGFGIGHAVEGSYKNKGWFFSVGEVGALFGAVAFAKDCHDPFASSSIKNCGGTYVMAGVYAALRIWEIFDAWIAPSRQNILYDRLKWDMKREYQGLLLMPMPLTSKNIPGIAASYTF